MYEDKRLPNMAVLVNDTNYDKVYGYGYGYAYGYGKGYGYGYYSEAHRKSGIQRMIAKIKNSVNK
jgi:hypothetical protein